MNPYSYFSVSFLTGRVGSRVVPNYTTLHTVEGVKEGTEDTALLVMIVDDVTMTMLTACGLLLRKL